MLENFSECIRHSREAVRLASKNGNSPVADCDCRMLGEEHVGDICRLYESYDGCQEFLYVPSAEEVKEGILSTDSCYVGMFGNGNKLMGVAKLKRLEFPYPFFVLPKQEEKTAGACYGLSGLMVASEYRNKGVAKKLVNVALSALHSYGAKGIYADCEYRNRASFLTLSHTLNFIGFVDGRNGAEGEKTMYMTFYRNCAEQYPGECRSLTFDFSRADKLDDAADVLRTQLGRMGAYTCSKVAYQGGYNLLYMSDCPVQTPGMKLISAERGKQTAKGIKDIELIPVKAKDDNSER